MAKKQAKIEEAALTIEHEDDDAPTNAEEVTDYFGSEDVDDSDLDEAPLETVKAEEAEGEVEEEAAPIPDGTTAVSEAKPAESTKAKPEEAPAQTKEPVPEKPKEPAEVAKPAQVAPQAEPQPPAEAPTETAPLTAETLTKQFAEKRSEIETLLAERHYNVPAEMVEAFETEPEKVIPKLMARVYMDAVTNSIGHVMSHLPQMIEQVTQAKEVSQKAETAFFETWPQLAEHRDTVLKFGQAYRQLYPGASQDEFIKNVGAQVVVAMRLPVTNGVAPAAPAAVAAPAPFVPASAGSPPTTGVTAPANPFAALAAEEENLDLD